MGRTIDVPLRWVEDVATLVLPEKTNQHLQQLMDRNNEGLLSDQERTILFDIRIPRVLLGACVGSALAVSGAALQSLLRNPLAEPYLLGVSNGAALGTMLAFVFFEQFEWSRPVQTPCRSSP